MPAEWAASVMEQLVHWTHFLFLGQAEGHPQQALPKIVPNYHGVGFACHDGSEFQTPAYLEPFGEGEKQVRYPSSLGRCDSVEGFTWPHAHVHSQAGHLQLLWVTVVRWWHFEPWCLGMRGAVSWKALFFSYSPGICIRGLCWKCQKVTKLRSLAVLDRNQIWLYNVGDAKFFLLL